SHWARRIQKHVIGSPVAGSVHPQSQLMTSGNIDIELGVSGVADLRGGIFSGQGREFGRCGKHQGGVGGLVVSRNSVAAGLRAQLRTAVQKLHDVGDAEDMLVKSGEKENFVELDGAADRA